MASKAQMKNATLLLPVFAVLLCAGCAIAPARKYIAPSVSPVTSAVSVAQTASVKAKSYVDAAAKKLQSLGSGDRPTNVSAAIKDVSVDLQGADTQLVAVQSNLADAQAKAATLQGQVNTLTVDANKEAAQAVYWHQKQEKALKELWGWRIKGILLIAGAALILVGTILWRLYGTTIKAAVAGLKFP